MREEGTIRCNGLIHFMSLHQTCSDHILCDKQFLVLGWSACPHGAHSLNLMRMFRRWAVGNGILVSWVFFIPFLFKQMKSFIICFPSYLMHKLELNFSSISYFAVPWGYHPKYHFSCYQSVYAKVIDWMLKTVLF